MKKNDGWSTYYCRYDVCKNCRQHYGEKEIRRMMKEKLKQEVQ